MKIYSKTHDYYDGIARSWQSDPKRVFVRECEEIKLKKKTKFLPKNYVFPRGVYEKTFEKKRVHTIETKHILLFFCGEVFPIEELYVSGYNHLVHEDFYKRDYFYNEEEIQSKLEENYQRKFPKNKYRYSSYFCTKSNSEFFKENKDNHIQNKQAHLDLNCAYFTIDENYKLIKYPVLKDIGFQKIMSDFECWQKIEQFLTNDLVPPDMVEHKVPDSIKAESHGFNKYSFRKEKDKQ